MDTSFNASDVIFTRRASLLWYDGTPLVYISLQKLGTG